MLAGVTIVVLLVSPGLHAEETPAVIYTPASFSAFNASIARAERLRLAERFDDARAELQQADALAKDEAQSLMAQLSRGLLLAQTGSADARKLLEDVYAMASASETRVVRVIAGIDLARLAAESGDRAAAIDYAEQAGRLSKGLTQTIVAAAKLATIRNLAIFGDPKDASERLAVLLASGTLDPNRFEDGQLLIDAAKLARKVDAIRLAERALEIARQSDQPAIALLSSDELADLLEANGDAQGALALSAEILGGAQARANSNLIFRAAWRRGRIFAATGDTDAALAAYRAAFGSLRALRVSSGDAYIAGQSLYRLRYGAFHLSFVDILTRADGGEGEQARLYEARDVIEDLKTDEVEDYFQERCVPGNRVAVEVSKVADRTAVIYPIILPDRLEVLMEREGRIYQATTTMSGQDIERLVRIARIDFEIYGRAYQRRAAQIYDMIIRPFEDVLEGADTLVYVPDGVLRLLPVSALSDGQNFVIEKFAVATVLGLSLLETGEISASEVASLVAGATEVEGFAPLPSVEREIAEISETLGSTVLSEDDFEADQFGATLQSKPFGVVHIATHAQIGGQPSDNFIATKTGPVDMNLVALTLQARSLATGVPLDLVTLSACATASGDDRAPLGLAGIAYRAGARSVLASLWPVFDNATADLMASFYQELAGGAGRAEALRRAQTSLISADPSNRHPSVWAAFTMVGEWR